MSKYKLPTISKEVFLNRIKDRKYEDLDVINTVESLLLKKRGYVFKMPKKNDPVILLLSGGLDSISSWAILMKKYELQVYPLYISRTKLLNMINPNYRSVRFFSKIYKKKYTNYYHKPYIANLDLHPKKIFKDLNHYALKNQNFFFSNINTDGEINFEYAGLMDILGLIATDYSKLVSAKTNVPVSTIFNSVTANDGQGIKSQTFTSLRVAMLNICTNTNNYSMQYIAIPFEKDLGNYLEKSDLINWTLNKNIPIHKAWSCYKNIIKHCGICPSCLGRQFYFNKSSYIDKTTYHKTI